MDKAEIINMKRRGKSNRAIMRETGIDRKTVAKYWEECRRLESELQVEGADIHSIQEKLCEKPQYKKGSRRRRKYTEEIDALIHKILQDESAKNRLMGAGHKQKKTNIQIHEEVLAAGHEISLGTINIELARIRQKRKEAYIRQEYDYGQRLEYDFGEVKLDCGEGIMVYHMAVFTAPASGFRWLYLYTNEKKAVFMDSHVRFFEMVGGVYLEVVYDNMKNVVKKFIGRTEKELNPDLINMSLYYGFKINVTNCYRGNEKGSVEKSVDYLRNRIFSDRYVFSSLEAAQEFAISKLCKLNEKCTIEEEKEELLPYKPKLELAVISENTVSSYSFISVDTVFYSVPEELVGKKVAVKKYHDEIRVFCDNSEVCRHKRIFGNGKYQIDIYHYLNTLYKKPGALKNSAALRQLPKLKALFDGHFTDRPRYFVELLMESKDMSLQETIKLIESKLFVHGKITALDIVKPVSPVSEMTTAALSGYADIVMWGGQHAQ
jgi:transposase